MMSTLLFDSHAHYFDRRFTDCADRILSEEIFGNGVGHVVNVGTNPKNSRISIEMSKDYAGMYATVGIHPEDLQLYGEDPDKMISEIEALISDADMRRKNKIVALGEIGLDYHEWADGGFIPDRMLQKEYFSRQLSLAEKYDMKVVVHDREAHGDCFETVLRFPNVTGVFHSYSGSAEMARELMRRGWYISFSGVVTFKNAERVREVVKGIDLDKLLIETDAPYLAPHPFRGQMNHSGLMRYTAEAIAAVKELQTEDIIRITTENAIRFFGISE